MSTYFSTYDVSNGNKAGFKASKEFADHFESILDSQKNGLFLFGKTGVGKTHLASSIMHSLIDNILNDVQLEFEEMNNFRRETNRTELDPNEYDYYNILACEEKKQKFNLKFITSENYPHIVKSFFGDKLQFKFQNDLIDSDLLVFDDIGLEPVSDYNFQILTHLINIRYDYCRPTVFTSQFPIEKLMVHYEKNFGHDVSSRLIGRLIQMCRGYEVVGENRRLKL